MNAETQTQKNHAAENADAHAQHILALYRAHLALEDGAETASDGYDDYTSSDDIRERVQEDALSIEVRAPWYSVGDEAPAPDEFSILITTGGPALRIRGELKFMSPRFAWCEVRDWGTFWENYTPHVEDRAEWSDALAWFVSCFYFGEG